MPGSPSRSRRAAGIAVGLFAAAASLAAQDLLLLRSGERRSGALKSCLADRCALGGRPVPRDEIAWVGLGRGAADPPALAPSATDRVVLTDGTVRTGAVSGVSLGVVALEGGELDRSEVAWIRFADPGAVAADQRPGEGGGEKQDRVVLRDGSIRTGELVACAGSTCLVEGAAPLRRSEIAAIALGGGEAAPGTTTGTTSAEDRLVLRSGESRDGPIFGVSPQDVVAISGRYERSAVAALLFAAEPEQPAPGGAGGSTRPPDGGPQPGGAPPGGPPPPAPPAPPVTPPPPAPGASGGPGQRGALWTGTLTSRHFGTVDDVFSDWTSVVELRLREYRFPLHCPVYDARGAVTGAPLVGSLIRLEHEGSTVASRFTSTSRGGDCSGEGSAAISTALDEPNAGHASAIWIPSGDADLTGCLGGPVEPGRALYTIGFRAREMDGFVVSCTNGARWDSGFMPLVAGWYPTLGSLACADPGLRYLEGDGGVMRGSYSTTCTGCCPRLEVSWSVCREGASCPPPPPHAAGGEPFDPCGRAGQQAALRDTCHAQLDALVASLEPAFAEYNGLMAAAEANRAAFQAAQDLCALYDQAKTLLEAILTGGAGSAAEAARALLYLRDVIDRAMRGDLASMLYPDQVKKALKAYKQVKDAWFELTADELSKMGRDLGACSGKVPVDTYMKAKQFLEDLGAAKRIWDSRVAPGLNDLRTKALECAWWDHAAWRACLADAACRGVPPDCGQEPTLAGAYDE